MSTKKYPHLIIKEGDIQKIEYEPQGRTKSITRNIEEHGQYLLDGIEQIITKQSSKISSLDNNNLIFEIKLHESQKFQNKERMEFLKKNKIRINVIKNQNQAIVSAMISDFNSFEKKVFEYKNSKRNHIQNS